ncbi:MAG: gfo/Idh/MocA family oxidoreductase, partial [Armatimonadota bacterium]
TAYWPPAHNIGYEHSTINTVRDLLEALSTRENPHPDFEDGVYVNAVMDAVEKANKTKRWERVRY